MNAAEIALGASKMKATDAYLKVLNDARGVYFLAKMDATDVYLKANTAARVAFEKEIEELQSAHDAQTSAGLQQK